MTGILEEIVDLFEFDQRLRPALQAFPTPVRRMLLDALGQPDEGRAKAIGQFYQSGVLREAAEFLIDLELEEDAERLRARVLDELLRMEGDESR